MPLQPGPCSTIDSTFKFVLQRKRTSGLILCNVSCVLSNSQKISLVRPRNSICWLRMEVLIRAYSSCFSYMRVYPPCPPPCHLIYAIWQDWPLAARLNNDVQQFIYIAFLLKRTALHLCRSICKWCHLCSVHGLSGGAWCHWKQGKTLSVFICLEAMKSYTIILPR